MRYLTSLIAYLFFTASSAWAMAPGPCQNGVCIGYSTNQAVPLSPEAMGLLALILGVLAYATLRGKVSRIAGVALAMGLTAMLTVYEMKDSLATVGFDILLSAGNPAEYTFGQETFPRVISVQNNLGYTATITSISANPYTWDTAVTPTYTPCAVGLALPPNGVCAIRVAGPI